MKRRCLGRGRGEANVLRFVTGSFSYGTNCTYIVIFPFQKKKNQKTKTSSFSFVLKTKTLTLPGLGQMLPWQFLVRVTTPPTPVKKKAVDSRTPDLLCGCLFRCPLKGVISTMVLSSGPWMWGVGVTDGVRGLGTEFLYGWA